LRKAVKKREMILVACIKEIRSKMSWRRMLVGGVQLWEWIDRENTPQVHTVIRTTRYRKVEGEGGENQP